MAESHVVSGLLSKRAELGGMVEHHRKEIEKIETFLTHIDATIRVFAPEIDLRTMKPKAFRERASFFKHGDAPKTLLDILRKAGRPLSSREMTEIVLATSGLEATSEYLISLQKSILVTIKRMEDNHLVRIATVGKAGMRSWEVA